MGAPTSAPAAWAPATAPPRADAPTRGVIAGRRASSPSRPGLEMRVGRDGATCQILLTEPRVSGTHATLKFEAGQLLVRDEGSNNGTYLNGQRIPAGHVDAGRPRGGTPLRPRRVCRPFGVGSCPPSDEPRAAEPPRPVSKIEFAQASDPGRDPNKQVNEDSCGYAETRFGHLAVLCDGMGGHYGGKEASRTAITTIFEVFEQMPTTMLPAAGPQGRDRGGGPPRLPPRRPAREPRPPRLDRGGDAPPRPRPRRRPRRRQPRLHHPLQPDLPPHPRPLDGAGHDRRRDAHRRERRWATPTRTRSPAPSG